MLIRSTVERLKQSADVENDPLLEHLEGTVVRTMAELEVARLHRAGTGLSKFSTIEPSETDETSATAA